MKVKLGADKDALDVRPDVPVRLRALVDLVIGKSDGLSRTRRCRGAVCGVVRRLAPQRHHCSIHRCRHTNSRKSGIAVDGILDACGNRCQGVRGKDRVAVGLLPAG